MAFEAGFLSLMPHTITLASWSGFSTDGYGKPTYGTATSIRARVGHPKGTDLVRSSTGQSIVPSLVCWMATTRSVTVRDQFTYAGSTYRIVRVEQPADEDGAHHTKVWLGR